MIKTRDEGMDTTEACMPVGNIAIASALPAADSVSRWASVLLLTLASAKTLLAGRKMTKQ
jgi:hypothetical protein